MAAIHKLHPDVVFLDIQMPRISGLEMLGMLDKQHMPKVVFVTAYDEYALSAFEEHASDYLLKPVDPERLATEKGLSFVGVAQRPSGAAMQLRPVKVRNNFV